MGKPGWGVLLWVLPWPATSLLLDGSHLCSEIWEAATPDLPGRMRAPWKLRAPLTTLLSDTYSVALRVGKLLSWACQAEGVLYWVLHQPPES